MKRKVKFEGRDELNKMFDSMTDPKFRAQILRKAAKTVAEPMRQKLEQNSPDIIKDKTKTRIKINRIDKAAGKVKLNRAGVTKFVSDKNYAELYIEWNYDNESMALARVLELGRKKAEAKIGKDKKWHAWGKPTSEVIRNIGTTQGRHFVEKTYHENIDFVADAIIQEIQQETLKHFEKEKKKAQRAAKRAEKAAKEASK